MVFPVDRWWYRIIKFYPNHQIEYEGYGNARYNFDSIRTWHWYDTAGKLIKTKHFDEFAPIYQEEIGMLEELDQFQIYTELHLSPTLIDHLKNIEFKKKHRGTIRCKVTFNSEGKIQSVVPQHIDKNLESQYDLISAVIQKSTLVPYSYRDVAYSGELLMRIVIAN